MLEAQVLDFSQNCHQLRPMKITEEVRACPQWHGTQQHEGRSLPIVGTHSPLGIQGTRLSWSPPSGSPDALEKHMPSSPRVSSLWICSHFSDLLPPRPLSRPSDSCIHLPTQCLHLDVHKMSQAQRGQSRAVSPHGQLCLPPPADGSSVLPVVQPRYPGVGPVFLKDSIPNPTRVSQSHGLYI